MMGFGFEHPASVVCSVQDLLSDFSHSSYDDKRNLSDACVDGSVARQSWKLVMESLLALTRMHQSGWIEAS